MLMKKILSLLLVFVMVLSFVGCTSNQQNNQNSTQNNNQSKEAPLAIKGMITQLDDNGENTVILVEGKKEDGSTYDKARVTINKDTKIYEKDKEISAKDLRLHMYIEVYYNGAVAESYPVQMGANKVVVVARPAIVGNITNITEEDGKTSIMVEGEQVEGQISDKAKVTLDEKTEIYKNEELKEWEKLTPEDLKLNMQVVVYYDGAVATSYPAQMGANKIVVISEETEETPAVKGTISEFNKEEKKFLVTGSEANGATYDKAYVTVNKNTKIYKGEAEATFEDLMDSLMVEVYYNGAFDDSYPVQMGADKIVIVEEKIAVRGTITEVTQNGDKTNILVEGEVEEDTSYDKAYVTLDENTKVYQDEKEMTIKDLAKDMKIEVYYNGSANLSYPVQIGADKINILK